MGAQVKQGRKYGTGETEENEGGDQNSREGIEGGGLDT